MQLDCTETSKWINEYKMNGHEWRRKSQEIFFFFWPDSPQWAGASSFTRFLDNTQRRTTVSRIPLDEWSARRRDNTQHSQQINIHARGGIRTHNLSKRAAADLRLRPRGHWDRHRKVFRYINKILYGSGDGITELYSIILWTFPAV